MSNVSALIVGFGSDIPNPPIDVIATCGISLSTINLSWTDNSDNENSFKIYKSTDGTNFSYINSVFAGVTTYTATEITNLQNYWFRVTAYNTAGESAYTQFGPLNCNWVPTPPSNLNSICSVTHGEASLLWTDNSSNEDGFKIYKSIDGNSFNYLATVGTGGTTYTVTGIIDEQQYWFRVTAYNLAGESTYTQTAPLRCNAAAPEISQLYPIIGQSNVRESPFFYFVLTDTTEVDLNSLNVTINNIAIVVNGLFQGTYTGTFTSNSENGYNIKINSIAKFNLNQVVPVYISIKDTNGLERELNYNFIVNNYPIIFHTNMRRISHHRKTL